ncbi:tape measure domain-containing protein [Brevibacterium pityocampae]
MASPIGGAFIRVSPTFPGFQSKAKAEAGKLEQTFGKSGGSSGRSFASALGKTVKVGAVAVGTAAATGLGYALKKGFDRLVDIENATASLTGLGHSAKSVQQIMDNALASVKGTSFGMGEAAKVAASAVAAGVKPGQDLERTLRLTGDAATIANVSMGEMGYIFNKVASSNKMQADSANMLLDRGIPIWQMLSDSMGITVEQVQKLSKEGKIGFADFQKAMEEGLGGAALEVGNTTTGALKNIGAAASRLGATLLAGAFPQIKPLFISIIGVIDRLTDSAAPLGTAIGKTLTPAIAGLSSWLDGLRFDSFQAFLTSAAPQLGGVTAKAGGLNGVLAALAPTGRAVGMVMDVVGGVLGFLGRHIDTVVRFLPLIIAGFVAWRVASFAMAAATERLRWAEVAMTPVLLANSSLRLTAALVERQNAKATGQATLAKVQSTAALSANTTATGANRATVLLSAAATKWHSAVSGGLVRQFVAQKVATVTSTAAMVGHKVATVATTIATKAATVATRALNLAMKAGPWMLIIGAIAAVGYGLHQFFTKTDEGRAIWSQFTSDLATAFAPVRAELARLQPVFSQLLGTFTSLGSELAGTFTTALSSIMPPVMGLVSSLARSLVPVISQLVTSLMPAFASVFGAVASVLGVVLAAVMPIVSALVSVLVPVIRVVLTIVTAVVKVLAAVLVPVIRVVAGVITWLADSVILPAFTAIGRWFSTTFVSGMGSGLTSLGGKFSWLYTAVVLPVWRGIQAAIGFAWNAVIKPIFSVLSWWVENILVNQWKMLAATAVIVWRGIQMAVGFAWNSIIKPVFNALVGFVVTQLVPRFLWLQTMTLAAWARIRAGLSAGWNWIKAYVFQPIVNFIVTQLVPRFLWLQTMTLAAWARIRAGLSAGWNWIKAFVFQPIVNWINQHIVPRFQFMEARIRNSWAQVRALLDAGWQFIRSRVFDPLSNAVRNSVPAAFRAGKDAIARAWDKVRDAAKAPVRFVIDTVINKGVIDKFNDIAKFFQVPEKDRPKRVKMPPGFRRGGKVWGEGTETSDSIPAMLSNNEHVWTAKEVRGAGGHGAMYKLRDLARRGALALAEGGPAFLPALAGGGTLIDAANWWVRKGARGSRHPAFGGAVRSGHSRNSLHYQDRAVDLNFGPGGQNATEMGFFDRHVSEFKKLFPKIRVIWRAPGHYNHMHIDTGNGADIGNFSGAAASGAGASIDGFLAPFTKIKDAISGQMERFGPVGKIIAGAGRWAVERPIQWIKDNISRVSDLVEDTIDSAGRFVRNTVAQGRGRVWAHAKGVPWGDLDYIASRESGWDPQAKNPRSSAAGIPQLIADNQRTYGVYPIRSFPVEAQLNAMHRYVMDRYKSWPAARRYWQSHRHYAGGGAVLPRPVKYDAGGYLPPGLTTVLNATGKPEPVFTEDQFATMRAGGDRPVYEIGQIVAVDPDEALRALRESERRREALYA